MGSNMQKDGSPPGKPKTSGPLAGIRVVEFAGIGPGPHCAMLLSDLGAEVLKIEPPGGELWENPITGRGRGRVEVDIRSPSGRDFCLAAIDHADVLLEGFRPGVMERLGLGPEICLARRPVIIYGRMTGWGQCGPLSKSAGHDLNYIAVTGALAAMGSANCPPPPPLNLVGDFGGGSLYLALGIVAALLERQTSGVGQVVDAAIVDGVSSMMSMFTGFVATGAISIDRRHNFLAGSAPFYRCYECADRRYVSVGPIEPKFYRELLQRLGLAPSFAERQYDPNSWTMDAEVLAALFLRKGRDEWCAILEGTDACFAPVLNLDEVPDHAHMRARGAYVRHEDMMQPAPAPRFSRSRLEIAPTTDGSKMVKMWCSQDDCQPVS